MAYKFDAAVIGAGVVGLACAVQFAKRGLQTVLLERESNIGKGISSRSSEVIHAGLYYAPGSLKARLCRKGAERLYSYCEHRSVPYRRIGKLVVAVDDAQVQSLEAIAIRARANGCNVSVLSGGEAVGLEPELRCQAAMFSPDTGIIDSHSLMISLLAEFESSGGIFARHASVGNGSIDPSGIFLKLDDAEKTWLWARHVVNAAGLDAPLVAARIEGFPPAYVPERSFVKGSYFFLSGKNPFSKLIYPIPDAGGLGVHLTIDLEGRARFGPDVECVEEPDYTVDMDKRRGFYEAIRRYWPNCKESRLGPGYAGVRPKLGRAGSFSDDFVIQSANQHGIAGLINLFGIESPGLTSCLAIADEVIARLELDELEDEE